MKKNTQREQTLKILEHYKGHWIDFRFFRYSGISQPGSRSSELRRIDGIPVQNSRYFNRTGQKCSYYALNPRKPLKEAIASHNTIEYDNVLFR